MPEMFRTASNAVERLFRRKVTSEAVLSGV